MTVAHFPRDFLARSRPFPRQRVPVCTPISGLLSPAKTVKSTESGKNTTKSGTQNVRRTTTSGRTTSGRSGTAIPPAKSGNKRSQFYFSFTGFPFPLGPAFQRQTARYEVVKDTIWTFEQTQALESFDVYTPVRMTVIKLKSGGLWVHSPIAPTDECLALLRELGAPVEYIVLGTFAYEHKQFVGPFSRKFPKAKVYISPYQWSFPLNLPPQFFGIFPAGELRDNDLDTPWADEIEQKVFLPPTIGIDSYVRFTEVAFFHKRTKTLLVTDAVVYLNDKIPDVIPDKSLVELGRDNWLNRFVAGGRSREEVQAIANTKREDTLERRKLAWKRMCLLVLYFGPGDLLTPEASWDALKERLFVGPVLETLVYSKVLGTVRAWVDDICTWPFQRIIPCHFTAPVRAGPAEFKRAFAFAFEDEDEAAPEPPLKRGLLGGLFGGGGGSSGNGGRLTRPVVFPDADIKTLRTLDRLLVGSGAVYADAEQRAKRKQLRRQQQ